MKHRPEKLGTRVLVVDEDLEFGNSLRRVLERAGYQVIVAEDVQQARRLMGRDRYPLVLLDIQLPGKKGLQLLNEIRESAPESHVILVSVNAEPEWRDQSEKAGAFAFLTKPVKRKDLLSYASLALRA